MERLVSTTVVLVFAAVTALCAPGRGGQAAAQAIRPSENGAVRDEGVVVLKSGGVLSGRISRDADHYVVAGPRSEVRLRATDVALVAGSLDEVYEAKRRQMILPTAEAHLELAEWCLRHDLTSQAKRHWEQARRLDPRHPRLALVARRIAVATRPPATSVAATAEPANRAAPAADELARLEALARGLPDEVVERFTRKVQPLLVNNCTTAGCHQIAGKQDFQLDRALLHGLANRRSTLGNLAATLAIVDSQSPHLSPLLTVPRRAHGSSKQAILGPLRRKQFDQLVEWVALVAKSSEVGDVPATMGEAEISAPERAPSGIVPAGYDAPSANVDRRIQFGARVEPVGPRDPFDPAIFNRQNGR